LRTEREEEQEKEEEKEKRGGVERWRGTYGEGVLGEHAAPFLPVFHQFESFHL